MLLYESSQVIQYQEQSNLAFQLLVRSKWPNNGLGRAHDLWLYQTLLGSPFLTRPYLLEDATQDNLPYPKELPICSYRMTWHCYIPLQTFPRPIVRYAYRYSIRRRSRLTVIILDLSEPIQSIWLCDTGSGKHRQIVNIQLPDVAKSFEKEYWRAVPLLSANVSSLERIDPVHLKARERWGHIKS